MTLFIVAEEDWHLYKAEGEMPPEQIADKIKSQGGAPEEAAAAPQPRAAAQSEGPGRYR